MRKGVIRPRQFGGYDQLDDKKDGYSNNKSLRGLRKPQNMAIIAALVVMMLFFFGYNGDGNRDSVSVSVSIEDRHAFRGGNAMVDDEEDDGMDGDNEEDDDEGANNNGRHRQQHDDEDEDADEGEEDEEDHDADAGQNEHDDEHDAEGDFETQHGDEGVVANKNGRIDPGHPQMYNGIPIENAGESFMLNGHHESAHGGSTVSSSKALTIDSYFINLGKKAVNISPSGSFKFVLVHARDKNGDGAYIVQGCSSKSTKCKHPDAYRLVKSSLVSHGLEARILGGGRITRHHLRKSKKAGLISIFGYSRTYGRCPDCNKKACDFIAAAYPDYVVRWSNEGYNESDESSIHDFVKCSAP